MAKTYVGTVGLQISVETRKDDLDAASTIKLVVQKPDGTVVEWPATANGTKAVYVTQDGDLDQSGLYSVQVFIEYPDGSKYWGETDSFPVLENFE